MLSTTEEYNVAAKAKDRTVHKVTTNLFDTGEASKGPSIIEESVGHAAGKHRVGGAFSSPCH